MTNDLGGTQFRDEPDDSPDARADELVDEIAQTRDEMSETVQAIGEKLAPGNIAREASETVKSATVGKVEQMAMGAQETWRDVSRGNTSGIVDTITSNPIPAGMVAVGLAMLFMNRGASSGRRAGGSVYPNTRYGTPDYSATSPAWQPGGSYRGGASGGSPVDRVGSAVSGVAGQAGSTVSQVADQAGQAVGDVAGNVGETASQAQYEAQRLVRQGTGRFRQLLDESPLVAGAMALAAGAVAGTLIPTTEPERRTLGEARDQLVGQAESAAHETLDKVEDQLDPAGS